MSQNHANGRSSAQLLSSVGHAPPGNGNGTSVPGATPSTPQAPATAENHPTPSEVDYLKDQYSGEPKPLPGFELMIFRQVIQQLRWPAAVVALSIPATLLIRGIFPTEFNAWLSALALLGAISLLMMMLTYSFILVRKAQDHTHRPGQP